MSMYASTPPGSASRLRTDGSSGFPRTSTTRPPAPKTARVAPRHGGRRVSRLFAARSRRKPTTRLALASAAAAAARSASSSLRFAFSRSRSRRERARLCFVSAVRFASRGSPSGDGSPSPRARAGEALSSRARARARVEDPARSRPARFAACARARARVRRRGSAGARRWRCPRRSGPPATRTRRAARRRAARWTSSREFPARPLVSARRADAAACYRPRARPAVRAAARLPGHRERTRVCSSRGPGSRAPARAPRLRGISSTRTAARGSFATTVGSLPAPPATNAARRIRPR